MRSCRFANFTMDARVSPVSLPIKCACLDSKKYVSLDFSSLTETCQTTDATISSSCGNWRDHISKKASIFKSTPFASYRLFLVQNWATICSWKVQYIPAWIGRCLWVQKLVITILCATFKHIRNKLYEFTLMITKICMEKYIDLVRNIDPWIPKQQIKDPYFQQLLQLWRVDHIKFWWWLW